MHCNYFTTTIPLNVPQLNCIPMQKIDDVVIVLQKLAHIGLTSYILTSNAGMKSIKLKTLVCMETGNKAKHKISLIIKIRPKVKSLNEITS